MCVGSGTSALVGLNTAVNKPAVSHNKSADLSVTKAAHVTAVPAEVASPSGGGRGTVYRDSSVHRSPPSSRHTQVATYCGA